MFAITILLLLPSYSGAVRHVNKVVMKQLKSKLTSLAEENTKLKAELAQNAKILNDEQGKTARTVARLRFAGHVTNPANIMISAVCGAITYNAVKKIISWGDDKSADSVKPIEESKS